MKTAISIPDPLFRAVDRLAKRLRLSRSQVFQQAVRDMLESRRDEAVTEALNQVYGLGYDRAELDPILERMEVASVVREKW
ncbi:MAG: ribbon-helix-helix protein, CopG family [Candidatus Eisenbacteria bacterium]|nr:ribbon-helix-helix protein, CopG family [Candidatus Eisenbacteria bacterium]